MTANTDVSVKNKNLNAAMVAKKDEFYTQLADVEKELRNYRKHFRGKVVLCNCDDPFESNFFKYFVMNFRRLGIKKLIASCYSGSPVAGEQISLFDLEGMSDADAAARRPYKIEITEIPDANGDGAIDLSDVEHLLTHDANVLTVLEGSGDFRSKECLALLDEADIVVTNPPFSLFRPFVSALVERDKQFLIIGDMNAITYRDAFELIRSNKMWLGVDNGGNKWFRVPEHYEIATKAREKIVGGVKYFSKGSIVWFTNLDHAKRHENLILVEKYDPDRYPTYDNYDAIEVSRVAEIPEDWEGVMGVPITFLDKYNPEQFEILFSADDMVAAKAHGVEMLGEQRVADYFAAGGTGAQSAGRHKLFLYHPKPYTPYKRILIRRIGATS